MPGRFKLSIELDYGSTDLTHVSVLDFIAGTSPVRVSRISAAVPEKVITVDYEGWAFPRSGVAFVWSSHSSHLSPPESDRRTGACTDYAHEPAYLANLSDQAAVELEVQLQFRHRQEKHYESIGRRLRPRIVVDTIPTTEPATMTSPDKIKPDPSLMPAIAVPPPTTRTNQQMEYRIVSHRLNAVRSGSR